MKLSEKIIVKLRIVALIVIPIIFLLVAFQIKKGISNYSLVAVDPEMAYLYNSLTIAHGHYTHFVDHPGIPLQYVGAAVIGIVSIFRTKESITQDVISCPDFYIHSINITVLIILSFALFALGYYTYKYVKNIYSGLIIQLTPFISFSYLATTNRLLPELLGLIIIAGLFIFLLFYMGTEDIEKKRIRKYLIWMAIFSGLGISLKITFFPFIIIPIIAFRKIKEKFQFGLYFLISATFFLIPALNRGNHFFSWIKDLFIHSGQYGKGESNIVDLELYKSNIIEILNNDPLYVWLILILVSGIIFYQIPKFKLKRKNDITYRLLIGFVSTSILITLVIAKQLKFYYLSPAYLLVFPSIILFLLILCRQDSLKKYIFPFVFTILLLSVTYTNAEKIILSGINTNEKQRIKTLEFVNKNLTNVPIINVPNYYGSPFKGYCGYYGIAYSGKKNKEEVIPVLDKVFPDYYTYHDWNGKYNYWLDSGYTLHRLMNNYDSLYIYFGDREMWKKIWHDKIGLNQKLDYKASPVYKNDNSGEEIYKLLKNTGSTWNLNCNTESKDETGEYFITDKGIEIDGGKLISNEKSFSGKNCAKLDENNQYAFGVTLVNLKCGEHYVFTVWKFDNGNKNTVIVFEPVNDVNYYKATSEVVNRENNWVKIKLEITITNDLNGKEAKIYCWNGADKEPVYLDDFMIEKLK